MIFKDIRSLAEQGNLFRFEIEAIGDYIEVSLHCCTWKLGIRRFSQEQAPCSAMLSLPPRHVSRSCLSAWAWSIYRLRVSIHFCQAHIRCVTYKSLEIKRTKRPGNQNSKVSSTRVPYLQHGPVLNSFPLLEIRSHSRPRFYSSYGGWDDAVALPYLSVIECRKFSNHKTSRCLFVVFKVLVHCNSALGNKGIHYRLNVSYTIKNEEI